MRELIDKANLKALLTIYRRWQMVIIMSLGMYSIGMYSFPGQRESAGTLGWRNINI